MLRTHWQYNAASAVSYLAMSDYYATTSGELLGTGFKHLDISNMSARDVFESLCHNIDPHTGQKLRPLARDGERVGMDFTFNAPKSVTLAREVGGEGNPGDVRVEAAHREAVAYAMGRIEADMQTRVKGGREGDRITGNLLAYRVTHRDTRINAQDQMPDPHLHDHVFVLNTTYDHAEGRWKAAQVAQIKHDAPYYEALYMNRLASNLKDLGYGIQRKDKAFEINGISDDLITKFSRRRQYIKAVADKLGITSAAGMDKLGATTRLGKAKELADDLNGYYVSRLTDDERDQLADLKDQPCFVSDDRKAVEFAIGHMFERRSVVDEKRLYETAIRHGIGSVTVEGVREEAEKQGVLRKNGEATTKEVLAEEGRIIAFAREGRGTCRPMGELWAGLAPDYGDQTNRFSGSCAPPQLAKDNATLPAFGQQKGRPDESRRPLSPLVMYTTDHATAESATLSPDQQAVCQHIWSSTDRVIMIEGDAGTGKTQTMQRTIPGISAPGVFLAPSASASRGTLREKGFTNADTIAMFLTNEKFREKARNGYIYIDEAPLAGLKDIDAVFKHAKDLNARVILQGDRKQHKSVARGNLFEILDRYAGLPIGRLTKNWRQQGKDYKAAVNALAKGDMKAGFDMLNDLGWIKESDTNKPLVDDYLSGLNAGKEMLVVAPTHKEGDEITAAIRDRLKADGTLGEEREVDQLIPLQWTDAEKGDLERYDGTEVMQYFRNSGTFKAGQKVKSTDWNPSDRMGKPQYFAVYGQGKLSLAVGDSIRTTANVKDIDGKRIDNDTALTVTGFTENGIEVRTATNQTRILPNNVGHVTHAYVSTSHASQGKTVDQVLIAMGHESVPAINSEQFYVSVSRGRESARVYSDMSPLVLKDAITRQDQRKSATELMKPKRKSRDKFKALVKRVKETYRRLSEQAGQVMDNLKERDYGYGR